MIMVGRTHGTVELCGRPDAWTYAGLAFATIGALASTAAIIWESSQLSEALQALRNADLLDGA